MCVCLTLKFLTQIRFFNKAFHPCFQTAGVAPFARVEPLALPHVYPMLKMFPKLSNLVALDDAQPVSN